LGFDLFVDPLNKVMFDCDTHFCFHGFHNSDICLMYFILHALSGARAKEFRKNMGARIGTILKSNKKQVLIQAPELNGLLLRNRGRRITSLSVKGFYSLFKQIGFSRLMRNG
jgi:hypothetical protein